MDNEKTSYGTKQLIDQCRAFLKVSMPSGNVVLDTDFGKFIPLFNRRSVAEMTKDEINRLAEEYRARFSLQHPIKIISSTVVEGGDDFSAYYEPDGKYHRVIHILPPLFKPLHTLNEAGPKLPSLMTALMNASKVDNPLDHRFEMYSQQVTKALSSVNTQSEMDKAVAEFQETERKFMSSRTGDNGDALQPSDSGSNNSQSGDNVMSDVIEW